MECTVLHLGWFVVLLFSWWGRRSVSRSTCVWKLTDEGVESANLIEVVDEWGEILTLFNARLKSPYS